MKKEKRKERKKEGNEKKKHQHKVCSLLTFFKQISAKCFLNFKHILKMNL